jgi:Reverse transcriptase (RNA-dependent DNA polymerase)
MDLPLPPLRAINHTVPLIDENKIYPWRPSRCPEALRSQWAAKRDAYLRMGHWAMTTSASTAPMLMITKPGTKPPLLRSVGDLRARNLNTLKMASPLPDIDGIVRRVAKHKYHSLMDGKEFFEQIRIIPAHVPRTAMTTPDGTIVSYVVQQGDCNAPATCQALMNHLFSPYIGRWMDVYLDDIVIYSDSLEEHVQHVKW